MDERLPKDVTEFLSKHIGNLTQLELLLFLQERSDRDVTAAAAARELRMPEEQLAAVLDDLAQRGLAQPTEREGKPSYRYGPRSNKLARQVEALAETWPRYRHSIIRFIFSRPPESVTNFAEAFRLRKDDSDG